MKQILLTCLTVTTVLASGEHSQGGYAPYFGHKSFDLVDFGESIDLKSELKHEYPAGLIFGHGFIDGLHDSSSHENDLKGVNQQLEHHVSADFGTSFESTFPAPPIPQADLKGIIGQPQQAIKSDASRYTKTRTDTYEVREDNYEPIPVPKITPGAVFQPPALDASKSAFQSSLGSGSLGVAHVGNGQFSVGSGSLGFAGQQTSGEVNHFNFGGLSAENEFPQDLKFNSYFKLR